jgi:hypothetical protein
MVRDARIPELHPVRETGKDSASPQCRLEPPARVRPSTAIGVQQTVRLGQPP